MSAPRIPWPIPVFVCGECVAQDGFERFLPCLTLQLLRPLIRLSLQLFDLPPHVGELAILLAVLQAVLLRRPLLNLEHELGAGVRHRARQVTSRSACWRSSACSRFRSASSTRRASSSALA